MAELHIFQVCDGETHWYAAETAEEALGLHKEEGGDESEGIEVSQFSDGKLLTINIDGVRQTMPARDWATSKGCVGSTCY